MCGRGKILFYRVSWSSNPWGAPWPLTSLYWSKEGKTPGRVGQCCTVEKLCLTEAQTTYIQLPFPKWDFGKARVCSSALSFSPLPALPHTRCGWSQSGRLLGHGRPPRLLRRWPLQSPQEQEEQQREGGTLWSPGVRRPKLFWGWPELVYT